MRILLVEDDHMLGAATREALRDATHAVDWVLDGASALSAAQGGEYELMLLDLGLPKRDGLSVLQALRQSGSNLPILILTARDALEDRVRGLDLGADDYLVKPFESAELLARIRAVARRQGGQAQPVLSNGVLELDPVSREVRFQGQTQRLTAREYALLHALLLRPGAILSRSELEDRIYGWNEEVESNAVEFLIHSLRKKLAPDVIKNVRGVGWLAPRGDTDKAP
ncbi:MAG: response regulator transcription factor [Thiomonas sp.]|jgi:two-component system OmpR family response regulator|uniref:Two component transcriptional regulator, winged helix family n=1 Tax=Thiomonas intermedia (strain K12) TaxID=75379 RepID=D5X266_THIK1|nr:MULTISPECIES: response regulator transcription factor [Thiomonas]MDE1979418.1 response regulator transcription factor [Betaproteobacteria bacterium]CQR42352.1 Transcriptional regulatory protein QseB [Thiomonas sp. CB3]MBN8777345.1 response regulator transcription factor [Thiomonas arsenitoxydans]MDE2175147.1 response regulator transcription factor [Betaproteobacteria bacterium]MDE2269782.1 response regulator transcription factor [Betaproteobacteria bacterium]